MITLEIDCVQRFIYFALLIKYKSFLSCIYLLFFVYDVDAKSFSISVEISFTRIFFFQCKLPLSVITFIKFTNINLIVFLAPSNIRLSI